MQKNKDINECYDNAREFAINKSNFIYVNVNKIPVILDTCVEDNFLLEELATILKAKARAFKTPIKRYIADGGIIYIKGEIVI